jgi:hypothetical protein
MTVETAQSPNQSPLVVLEHSESLLALSSMRHRTKLLGFPPYSVLPWNSAGVDGVAKLLPHTHTNRMRHRSARSAKLNLAAAIRIKGAQAMVLLEEVTNIYNT